MSVVGLLIPMCTDSAFTVCEQPVDEQKTKSYQLSEKGFVFFWTEIKAESGEVFVLCCFFDPAIRSSCRAESRPGQRKRERGCFLLLLIPKRFRSLGQRLAGRTAGRGEREELAWD